MPNENQYLPKNISQGRAEAVIEVQIIKKKPQPPQREKRGVKTVGVQLGQPMGAAWKMRDNAP